MSEQLGTEATEGLVNVLAKGVILGKHLYADKTIDAKDFQYAPEAVALLNDVIALAPKISSVGAEFKDLDSAEILKLVSLAIDKVKEVEKA